MNHWSVWHGKESNTLVLDERPLWAHVLSQGWEWLTEATGHLLCCRPPNILWRIPLGWPRYDHNDVSDNGRPWLDNSIASKLFDLNNFMVFFEDRRATNQVSLPMTDEWMKEHGHWIAWLDEADGA